ncbi:MAG: hypothetical protein R3E66_16155 [bacterium]
MKRLFLCLLFVASACGDDLGKDSINTNNAANNTTNNASNNSTNNTSNNASNNTTNNASNNSTNNASNNSTNNNQPLTSVPAGDFGRRYAEMLCRVRFECVNTSLVWDYDLRRYGDLTTCLANAGELAKHVGIGAEVAYAYAQETISYDPALAAACINETKAEYCAYGELEPLSCRAFFGPKVFDDDACSWRGECYSGRCAKSPDTCGGVCQTRTFACGTSSCTSDEFCDDNDMCQRYRDVGEACEFLQCKDGLFCNAEFLGTGVCERYRSLTKGEPCFDSQACEPGLYCNDQNECSDMKLAIGEDCDTQGPPLDQCAGDAVCGRLGTCVPARTQAREEPCLLDLECQQGLLCATTCVAIAALGEPCSIYGECEAGAFCKTGDDPFSGICEQRKALGEACEFDGCELGLSCRNSVCIQPGQIGDPCAISADCQSHTCSEAGICLAEACGYN